MEWADPDIRPIGNEVEGLWVTGPGVPKKVTWELVGGSADTSP